MFEESERERKEQSLVNELNSMFAVTKKTANLIFVTSAHERDIANLMCSPNVPYNIIR